MKIIDAGHIYTLENYDGNKDNRQKLAFMKRFGDKFPFNDFAHDGTNCQEVLRALIDRCEYLQKQKPCAETECIIGSLRNALLLFELRAAREHGLNLKLESTQGLMNASTCKECGHVTCNHKEIKDD